MVTAQLACSLLLMLGDHGTVILYAYAQHDAFYSYAQYVCHNHTTTSILCYTVGMCVTQYDRHATQQQYSMHSTF
jgi:hypothetical protein